MSNAEDRRVLTFLLRLVVGLSALTGEVCSAETTAARPACAPTATPPNFLIHEMMLTDDGFRKLVTNENVKFEDGCLLIGDKPGLGIDDNVEEVLKRPYTPRKFRHYTGTLTDIRPKGDTFYYFEGLDCEHPVF